MLEKVILWHLNFVRSTLHIDLVMLYAHNIWFDIMSFVTVEQSINIKNLTFNVEQYENSQSSN